MFYKDHVDKSIATSKTIDTALLIGKLIIKHIIKIAAKTTIGPFKQNSRQLSNSLNKELNKNWAIFNFIVILAFSKVQVI